MELNRKNIFIIIGIVFASISLYAALRDLSGVRIWLGRIFSLILPFVIGGAVAFIINVPMRGAEKLLRKIFSGRKGRPVSPNLLRVVSLLVTLALLAGVITAVLFLVIPEIVHSVQMIIDQYPAFVSWTKEVVAEISEKYPAAGDYIENFTIDWESVGSQLLDWMKNAGGDFLGTAVGFASSAFGAVANTVIAVVFALDILLMKETLGRQARKAAYAFLPEAGADRLFEIAGLSDRTFSKFLSGQCLEAAIIGALFFVSMSIFRFHYAALVSVLIAVTALIPIVGAFIGCAVGAFLILIVDPMEALWFVVLFLVIQQIEGNLIYPKVVGGSIGLPAIWVLVALTIGGNTMGVIGMVVFIPLVSVLYALFRDSVNRRLSLRQIREEKLKP